MIRVLIADDHSIFRIGLKRTLEGAPDMEVAAEAATGEETLVKARQSNPNVVLLDVSMPGRGGVETAQELKRANPRVRVLMLTMHPEDQYAVLCLKLGADGYITKDVPPEVLLEAVRKVASGGKYVSSNLAERLATDLSSAGELWITHFGVMPVAAKLGLAIVQRTGTGRTRPGESVGRVGRERWWDDRASLPHPRRRRRDPEHLRLADLCAGPLR